MAYRNLITALLLLVPCSHGIPNVHAVSAMGPMASDVSMLQVTKVRDAATCIYRFVPTKLRGNTTMVQLSEIEFESDGVRVNVSLATNPGGNNAGSEWPPQAIDGNENTKWLDFNVLPLVLQINDCTSEPDKFRFKTGNDEPDRDPSQWKLQKYATWVWDGESKERWLDVHVQSVDHTGLGRFTYTEWFPISEASGVGDPHLVNMRGEHFDIYEPGNVTLVQLPQRAEPESVLLLVEADARRVGGPCSVFFQVLTISGKWTNQSEPIRFLANPHGTPPGMPWKQWMRFGRVGLKVVHRKKDVEYLNIYVQNLGLTGYAVGGLLGGDDHMAVATRPQHCSRSRGHEAALTSSIAAAQS
jgi:hypothetical protein